mgnify:CR=1 FL=1
MRIFQAKRNSSILHLLIAAAITLGSHLASAATSPDCLGEGKWELIAQATGRFTEKSDNGGGPELIQLWYLKEVGPYPEYGRNVAALTLRALKKECLAAEIGYYSGRQLPNVAEYLRTNSKPPHQSSSIRVRKLSASQDMVEVNSIRDVKSYLTTALFRYDPEKGEFAKVWKGETGCNCRGASDESPYELHFSDFNGDGYSDFSVVPPTMEAGDGVVENETEFSQWVWDPHRSCFTRLFRTRSGQTVTWSLSYQDDVGGRACSTKAYTPWFCIPIDATSFQIVDWKDAGNGRGYLKYLTMIYGTRETIVELRICEVDTANGKVVADDACDEFILNSVYEDTILGGVPDFGEKCKHRPGY